ncbi:MAG: pyridoxamine 5'-phosphate oxidase family protein [Dehalococcoidia bacterium]|nr:pyridoxamine 5'-phosphate oxidase family protein [Dehalococcoidia bacterium]
MQREQIFDFMNNNPAFFLATIEGGDPRVRAMLLYKADESGVVFHTGPSKDVYRQILAHPTVQMCFYNPAQNLQIRVRGTLELSSDIMLKKEISSHPTRQFMQAWRASCATEEDFYNTFAVFSLKNGIANVWTFASNFAPREDIALA